ncbi:MAG: hypothetical protein AB1428_06930 [Bacteroidota bacterium]
MSQTAIRIGLLAVLCAPAFVGGSAAGFAQEQRRHFTSRGSVELGGSISFQATQPVANDRTSDVIYDLTVLPYVGYFILDGFELGVNPAGLVLTSAGSTTITSLRILAAPSYNFRTSTIATPFVEGLAGLTTMTTSVSGGGTSTASGFTWGGRAGVKVGVVERGLLNLGIQYLRITVNPSGAPGRNGSNDFSVTAGWTVWL